MDCADRTYAILEGRSSIGGTWDLFRYPGVRSDSDMDTLGYWFKPWEERKAIADGPSILKYVRETATENDIERHIRFGHREKGAAWESADARWTVDVDVLDKQSEPKVPLQISCNFHFMCSGYCCYDEGFTPDFAGLETFAGRVVHPQQWTDDVAYAGKRVVVIGSGATAVTLVPELAKLASHVTMLQRSPTYIVARPSEDAIATNLKRWLPGKLAYGLTRGKQILLSLYIFQLCRRDPAKVKRLIEGGMRMALGPDYDVAKHFTPRYNPWDQRLCLAPDGNFFAAIKSGSASVATDEIDCITATGIQLKSGAQLDADLIVTATGLSLQVLGAVQLSVDGALVDPSQTLNYKGLMFSGVPNLAFSFGYTNASWTLRCDLTCEYVCRLLNHMKKHGLKQCTPFNTDASITEQPCVDFSSGYFARSLHLFPKQGSRAPWKLHQNYSKDILLLRFGKVDDGVMQFA